MGAPKRWLAYAGLAMRRRLAPYLALLVLTSCSRANTCPTIDPERFAAALQAEWESRRPADTESDGDDEDVLVAEDDADDVGVIGNVDGDAFDAFARVQVPVTADQPVRGSGNALVTIVEFADFQCPFSARVQSTLSELLSRYEGRVRVVYRNAPLPFHDRAVPAAEAAREAFVQGGNEAFWAYHDLLFQNQTALSNADLERYATQVGLNLPRFRTAMRTHAHRATIDADLALAQRISANGTPNFFVDGKQLVGAQPLEAFTALIDAELVIVAQVVAGGVAPSDVYEHLLRDAPTSASPPVAAAPAPRPNRPDPAARYRVPVDDQPQLGPADALVTLVIFSDFQCPFCSRVEPTLAQLHDQYGRDLRIVWMNNPLPFHQNAMPAAEAAFEVYAQKRAAGFWAYHDLLFQNQQSLDRATLESLAQGMHLNMTRFRRALDDHTHVPAIRAQQDVATRVGATGTPAFFINGRFLSGARPIDQFQALIDEELDAARALVRTGVRRRDVYTVTIRDALEALAEDDSEADSEAEAGPTGDERYAIPLPTPLRARGPASAAVTLQVFSDFQCPFCARLVPTLEQLQVRYGSRIRIVFRDYPLPFHQNAMTAAEAAREVFAQSGADAFWRFHDLLFQNQSALELEDLVDYARQIGGIDIPRLRAALEAHRHRPSIQSDMAEIARAGITQFGTPSTFVGGRLVSGAQTYEEFITAIDAELARGGGRP